MLPICNEDVFGPFNFHHLTTSEIDELKRRLGAVRMDQRKGEYIFEDVKF